MTNKLTKEEEIKLILAVIINDYCTELNDNYGDHWEDIEPQFINELYKTLADEIARARVERVRGFSDYIVSELIKMPFINVKITKNSVGMMRNKFLKNENIKRHL